ncbi:MAG: protease inhibitor I42 family protein, partial [Dehalococcoidales bacterium]|nr:protease inhibitor I42 family protein [Dehalococcoidales bacterium]
MKKVIVTGMVLILMLFLLPSCGVSQEDYDQVSSDLTAAQSQIQSLQGDLTVAEEKLAEALAYAELLESVYAEFLDIPMYQAWLRVEVNQEFVIPLVSNPTTGYGWQASYDETMLELVEKTYEPGVAAKQDVVGAGGTELFHFRTLVEMGQTEITLVYKQPWEEPSPDDVTKVFTVNIVPTVIPLPPPEPVTPGYIRVYDYILGYGFEYPEDWETQ